MIEDAGSRTARNFPLPPSWRHLAAFVLPLLLAGLIQGAPPLGAEAEATAEVRPRLRALGVSPGVLDPGPLNAITDVEGVKVGHVTIVRG